MVSVMLYPCMFCVALSMDLYVLCIACLTVFVMLLLNVMELSSVVGGALLDRPCMVFHIMCVCACGPSERLDAPSICFVCVFVCRKLSPHLGVLELGHRCLLVLCCFFV